MSSLTKEQLRNELITHGVELPSSTARKSEYVELYQKYVAPVQQSKGDFSSDEEDLPNSTPITQASASLIVNGVDVSQLDDDELYSQLQSHGATLGPIVDTTRRVYQKKLYVLLGGSVDETPTYNGDVDQDEYSESEDEAVEETPQVVQHEKPQEVYQVTQISEPASPPPAQQTQTTEFRRRRLIAPPDQDNSEVIFDPDLHTPSPRRSLRTVTSSTSETISVRRYVNNGRSEIVQEPTKLETTVEPDSVGEGGKVYALGRLLVKLIILALLMAAALYAYQYFQNNPSESPFKAVEQMARQALDAAVGEKAAAEPEVAPADSAPEVVPEPVAPPAA